MWLLTMIGLIAIIMGFYYLFRPAKVKEMDKLGSKIVLSTEKMLEKRVLIGFFCLIAGLLLVYLAFWCW
ncbi:MAG: hypothetical protein ACE5JK_00265 [Candidatus Omnitrophota bacterium]